MTNAAAAIPERIVDLGDRPRKVVLDLNAFCLLEETLEREARKRHDAEQIRKAEADPLHRYEPFPGVSIIDSINWNKPGIRDLRLILWASLLSDDPDLTLDQLNKLCTFEKINELQPLISDLIFNSFPQQSQGQTAIDEEEEGQQTPEKKTARRSIG